MNVLIINGHKKYPYSQGKLNGFLFDLIVNTVSKSNEVMTTVIENGYDAKEETEKFKRADIIIFQTPVNWYSIPWTLKKYIDDVYSAGEFFASAKKYGQGGKFTEKKYMLSLTCAASEQEFNSTNGFFNIRSIDDIFISFHKTQEYCGMQKLKTFVVYDVFNIPDINAVKSNLINLLNIYFN